MMTIEPQSPTLFSALSSSDQAVVLSKLTPREYLEGDVLFHEGDEGTDLVFINTGKVKISKVSEEGRELLISYLIARDFFGELSVLTGQSRTADVTAVQDLEVSVMKRDDFLDCLRLTSFSQTMMTALAWRLYSSSERFSGLVLYNLSHNVLETLRGLAEPQLVEGEERLVVENRPTHQEIAALLGSSREVITRTLRHLQREGQLLVEGKRVIIM